MKNTTPETRFNINGYEISAVFAQEGNKELMAHVRQILISSFIADSVRKR